MGRSPRAWRSNSGRPISSSRSFSHLESPGWVVFSMAADWLMLPVSARLSSICRLRRRSLWVQSIGCDLYGKSYR
ncbi:hypothetical protein D9M69_629940 [compost metagenome]